MPRPIYLIFFFLILGILYAEFLPTLRPSQDSTAYSKDEPLTQNELILSWLDRSKTATGNAEVSGDFISGIAIPSGLDSVVRDTNSGLASGLVGAPTIYTPSTNYSPSPVPTQDQPFVGDVIPPANTALADAYAKGGSAWYTENDNVIVAMPDGTFRSCLRSTGELTTWQQDRLNYEPINSPNALTNYLTNYHGKVVAETTAWAFVKFPSGGFLKIAKPSTATFLTQQ